MSRKGSTPQSPGIKQRPTRRIHDETPEQVRGKLAGTVGCPSCGASYRNGRWTWKAAPTGSTEQVCPACSRIAADYPAAVLHVEGAFVAAHRNELIHLLRNSEERERADHPLNRIMSIADEGSGFTVSTTDAKLAKALGRRLAKAYDGHLEQPATTSDKENLVRVRWTRD